MILGFMPSFLYSVFFNLKVPANKWYSYFPENYTSYNVRVTKIVIVSLLPVLEKDRGAISRAHS